MYEFNGITTWSLQAIAIDFAIIIALFVSLKFIKGWVSNLHANDEITERDNFAFGISFAAGLVALAIVLSGVSSGAFAPSLQQEALQMLKTTGLRVLTNADEQQFAVSALVSRSSFRIYSI